MKLPLHYHTGVHLYRLHNEGSSVSRGVPSVYFHQCYCFILHCYANLACTFTTLTTMAFNTDQCLVCTFTSTITSVFIVKQLWCVPSPSLLPWQLAQNQCLVCTSPLACMTFLILWPTTYGTAHV